MAGSDALDTALATARERYVAAHPRSRQLAERAADVLPGGNTRSVLHIEPFAFRVGRFPSIDQVRLTNSGTEGNVMALLTAHHATGRTRVVVFAGAYHGGPLYFGAGGGGLRVPFDFAILPYNDSAAAEAEFAANGSDISCVLVEPMLGAGGCIPGRPEFLAALRQLTAAAGSVLIFDEVMTSRLAIGGAQELLGITPDMTTLGKYLARGLSFGAFGGRRDLMAAFDPGAGGLSHGGTFNNNAFTMAVGAAVHQSLIAQGALSAVNQRGDAMREALTKAFADASAPWSVTGWGSLANLHPVAGPVASPNDLRDADPRRRELLFHELLAAGFYIAPRGYIALTMDVTDDDVDRFVTAVARAS